MTYYPLLRLTQGDGLGNDGNDNPVCVSGASMAGQTNRVFECFPPLTGRYVNIRLNGKTLILALCEVQVFAYTTGKPLLLTWLEPINVLKMCI